ncbi:HET domain containing protein [Hyaloscypha variabilis]
MFAICERGQCLRPEINSKGGARIAFSGLLRWLDACEATKKAKSQSSFGGMVAQDVLPDLYENLQLHSRVIDLGRRRITQAPLKCRYVALSYVWGQKNFAQLNSKNVAGLEIDRSLDDLKVPATIRDAMTFCEKLGERYLWIDSLCIVQDTTDKHEHMRSMEAIYRGAVLTLVVAAGSHADHGIPGFQSTPSFNASVNSSVWNSRAWTYQERLLSNRIIIFSNDEIYFQCKHGNAQGNMYFDPHDQILPRAINDSKVNADDYSLQLEERVNFSVYTRIVSEYMSRRLTFPDDIENAFGGIGKIFSIIFGGSDVLYGIPLSALAICLLWYSEEPLERRKGSNAPDSNLSRFPSWSWVGWIGRVGFRHTRNIGDRLISKVSWLDPLNKLGPLSNEHFGPPERNWKGRSRWFRQMSIENGDHYYIRRHGNPAHWFLYPMEPFFHNPIPIDRETGILHLRTDLQNLESSAI